MGHRDAEHLWGRLRCCAVALRVEDARGGEVTHVASVISGTRPPTSVMVLRSLQQLLQESSLFMRVKYVGAPRDWGLVERCP
eukprot:6121029-Prymnesium_polylepis.1